MFKNLLPVFFFTLFAFVASGNLNAQCSELYFSEYVEGNFNNKALEIYNPTDNAIDLSGYRIIRWSNGNNIYDPIASVQLSGSINAKDVMVIVVDLQNCSLTGADTCVFQELKDKADLFVCPVYEESNALYHNGNDALSLNKIDGSSTAFGATGTFVDIFGLIGEDPGVSWTNTAPYTQSAGGAYWTRDKTLIRKPGVTAGLTSNPGAPYTGAWNPTVQWDTLSRNTFNHLGWHSCQCGDAPNGIDNVEHFNVSLYPNPANRHVYIKSDHSFIKSVEVFDLMGKSQYFSYSNQTEVFLDTEQFATGTYIVKTTSLNKAVSHHKLLIQ